MPKTPCPILRYLEVLKFIINSHISLQLLAVITIPFCLQKPNLYKPYFFKIGNITIAIKIWSAIFW